MDELKISLTPEAEQNTDEAIQCLIDAASQIFASSEQDFQALKNTKWYKRLWKIITFSKDNEKKLARGVSSLAKLQEIIMKALLLLAGKSAAISDFVNQHDKQIAQIAKDQVELAKIQDVILDELDRLKIGAEKAITLYDIEGDKRKIFMAAFCSVVDTLNSDCSMCTDYYNQIYYALDCADAQASIKLHSVSMLSPKEALLLYRVIMEYVFLATDSFACEAEVLNYLAVSPKDSVAIKTLITKQTTRGGKENLLLKYKSKDNYDEYIFVDDEEIDWDFEDEDAFESSSAPKDKPEMETVHINKLTQIRSGERLQFYKKNVYIEANIDCHGELQFYGCNIYYNVGTSIGTITLSPESQLNIWNSHVFGESLDETAFIRGKQADISCLNSTFHNCQRFIHVTDSEFYMDKCGVYNCIRGFVCVDNGINCSVENALIIVDDPAIIANETTYRKEHSGISSPNIFDIDRSCEYKNNLFYCPLELVDSLWLTVFWGDNHSVEHCTFITLGHPNIHYSYSPKTISDSLFVGGSSVINMGRGGELTASMFINCENAVECYNNSINLCYFIDCFGPTIRNSISGEAIIDDCVFLNTKHIPKPEKTHWLIDTLSCIHVGCNINSIMGKGYNNPNEIRNCLFYGLTQYENIIAPDDGHSKPEDTIAIIDSCRFINCDCVNTIKTDLIYHTEILNIKKTAKNVMKIIDCEGVSNKNWWRESTQYFSDEMAEIELSGKQWGCDFLHSDFYLEHNLNTDEVITLWIKDYEARVISETE